jgi:hypothetical protein
MSLNLYLGLRQCDQKERSSIPQRATQPELAPWRRVGYLRFFPSRTISEISCRARTFASMPPSCAVFVPLAQRTVMTGGLLPGLLPNSSASHQTSRPNNKTAKVRNLVKRPAGAPANR